MNENLGYYKFMKKQILVINMLNMATAPGYLLIGFLYTSMVYESIWMLSVVAITYYGHTQYKKFDVDMTIEQKNSWATKVRWFMFIYCALFIIAISE